MSKQEIVDHVKALRLENISVDSQIAFCKHWPKTREALLLHAKLIPALTFSVDDIIAAGDALAELICQ